MNIKNESSLLVYVVKNDFNGNTRNIIAPADLETSYIEENLHDYEYIDVCNTYLGYYGDRIEFIYE